MIRTPYVRLPFTRLISFYSFPTYISYTAVAAITSFWSFSSCWIVNGGLFLTWQMIATLISLLIGLVFCGHLFYQKQKRKWISEGTPGYLPLRHDSLELSSTSFSGNRNANRSSGSLNLLKNSPSNISIIAANGPPPLYLEQTALPANNNETNDLSR